MFLDDPTAYAPSFGEFAKRNFTLAASFPNYVIYDCGQDGRFVACPDAFSSPQEYNRHGIAAFQSGNVEAALEQFPTALRLETKLVEARPHLMLCLLALHRKETVMEEGLRILQQVPRDEQVNTNLALLHFELDRVEEGIAQCEKNLRLGIAREMSADLLQQLRSCRPTPTPGP